MLPSSGGGPPSWRSLPLHSRQVTCVYATKCGICSCAMQRACRVAVLHNSHPRMRCLWPGHLLTRPEWCWVACTAAAPALLASLMLHGVLFAAGTCDTVSFARARHTRFALACRR